MAIDVSSLVVKNHDTNEVIKFAADSLREINTNLQKAVVAENMGLVGQQQALLAVTYGILNELNQKLNGQNSINTL